VVLDELGFFTGLGTVIVFFAALARGGCLASAFQAPGSAARDAVAPVGARRCWRPVTTTANRA
jgi:hypothetical protein